MKRIQVSDRDLHRELAGLAARQPRLSRVEVFLTWFMRAFITEDERAAVSALGGGSNDGGIDAVLGDERAKTLFIIQGKYRKELDSIREKRADVVAFARIAGEIGADAESFGVLLKSLGACPSNIPD